MNLVLEWILTTLLLFYYILEAIVLTFVPSRYRKKCITGQTVLVTGAGSGLGRLMTHRFAELGCTVVIWDVNEKGNEETALSVKQYGSPVYAYTCDLSSREDVYRVAKQVKEEVGDIDILVNNAGIVSGKKFLQCPDNLIQKTMEVNVMAHFWTVKSFLPAMLAKNKGHIVTIASGAGINGTAGLADYCASKFAAVGFDESLRNELSIIKKNGVKMTVVCPYFINTGMFSGVTTRFPGLLDFLEPEYAVDKIMEAILTNQEMLVMPRLLYFVFALKNMMPIKAAILLNEFTGTSNSMDEFRGRAKTD